jgi:hypothetical protein
VHHSKRKLTKKRKKKISTHRSENFGYQKNNPLTKYYAKYIGKWEKSGIK